LEICGFPVGIQDMPSSFDAARNFDMAKAKPGEERYLQAFMGDEIFALKIRYMGKEAIKSKMDHNDYSGLSDPIGFWLRELYALITYFSLALTLHSYLLVYFYRVHN